MYEKHIELEVAPTFAISKRITLHYNATAMHASFEFADTQ